VCGLPTPHEQSGQGDGRNENHKEVFGILYGCVPLFHYVWVYMGE